MLTRTLFLPSSSTAGLHIPDGFLSVVVAVAMWAATIAFVAVAIRRTSRDMDERTVPLMGVLAAFIFAAQAFNFPVAGGTSGHMLGGALAAVLLGPWPALLIMTAVISLQALVFQDGGLLAMGANIFVMGIVTVWIGYFSFRLLARFHRPIAGLAAGWLSIEIAAIMTAFLLAASGTAALGIVLPAMAGVHALIGIGEGLITAAAIALTYRAMPGVFSSQADTRSPEPATIAAGGMVLALMVGILAVFFASGSPDGLEQVAGQTGFLGAAQGPAFRILPDYALPGVGNESLAGVLAIVIGTLLLFVVGLGLARGLRRRRAARAADPTPQTLP